MSAISDDAAAVKASFATIAAGLDGIEGDLKTLNDKITELLNGGTLTPEDQAALNEIKDLAAATATRVSAIDAETPPAPAAG